MRINLPARGRLAQEIKTAVIDRQMIHLASTARARSRSFKFIVTPKCAVEQNQIGVNGRSRNSHVSFQPLARLAQIGRMIRPKIETPRCRAIQSRETRYCCSMVESPNSPSAIRFRRSARECGQATRAQLGFRLSRKRRAASPVGAGATAPAHDRYLHWSKEHLRSECCAICRIAAAIASCFRFAGADQARRLLTTSSEILPSRR